MIPFIKYTAQGNHFVIIDETRGEQISEEQKSTMVRQIAEPHFGVGCDNVLFVQSPSDQLLIELKRVRRYGWLNEISSWSDLGISAEPTFVFRMFESDGKEAAMCGDGLISVAIYLSDTQGIQQVTFVTEIPTAHPHLRKVFTTKERDELSHTIQMGPTLLTPSEFVLPFWTRQAMNAEFGVERLPPLNALGAFYYVADPLSEFRDSSQATPQTHLNELDRCWEAYLVYSGEPHIVLIPNPLMMATPISSTIGDDFFFSEKPSPQGRTILLDRMGKWLNNITSIFPQGINLCLVHCTETHNHLEMRSFERGILHETFACGTGAVAVCAVASHLGLVSAETPISVRPYLTKGHINSPFLVSHHSDSWYLTGIANHVFTGVFFDTM